MINYHMAYYTFWSAMEHLKKSNIKCANLRRHLENVVAVYGLNELWKNAA
jgi:hypothetical protein